MIEQMIIIGTIVFFISQAIYLVKFSRKNLNFFRMIFGIYYGIVFLIGYFMSPEQMYIVGVIAGIASAYFFYKKYIYYKEEETK